MRTICPACSGDGVLDRPQLAVSDRGLGGTIIRSIDCPTCSGTGWLAGLAVPEPIVTGPFGTRLGP